ncbi:hypothetical protein BHM03_00019861, partial [Ensete ventricosum]
ERMKGGFLFRGWKTLTSRGFCSLNDQSLRVCVIGSGPAGFYTAEKVPTLKLCTFHDQVVVAYGAESDRSLGVPGEDLTGIYSAREFVWWYNGHPDCRYMVPDLKCTDTAVVLGQNSIFEAQIVNTYPILISTTCMKNLQVHIREADLVISPADEVCINCSTIAETIFCLKPDKFLPSEDESRVGGVRLEKTCLKANGLSGKQVAIGTGQFEDVNCGLVLKSIGYKSVPVDGLPFDKYRGRFSRPFGSITSAGVVPNVKGRVLSSDQPENVNIEQGLYVVGWLKRGPTGIVATNLYCAEETVS